MFSYSKHAENSEHVLLKIEMYVLKCYAQQFYMLPYSKHA